MILRRVARCAVPQLDMAWLGIQCSDLAMSVVLCLGLVCCVMSWLGLVYCGVLCCSCSLACHCVLCCMRLSVVYDEVALCHVASFPLRVYKLMYHVMNHTHPS